MKIKASLLLLSVLIYSPVVICQAKNQLTDEQKSWISKADRHEKDGWIYLHIEGMRNTIRCKNLSGETSAVRLDGWIA